MVCFLSLPPCLYKSLMDLLNGLSYSYQVYSNHENNSQLESKHCRQYSEISQFDRSRGIKIYRVSLNLDRSISIEEESELADSTFLHVFLVAVFMSLIIPLDKVLRHTFQKLLRTTEIQVKCILSKDMLTYEKYDPNNPPFDNM